MSADERTDCSYEYRWVRTYKPWKPSKVDDALVTAGQEGWRVVPSVSRYYGDDHLVLMERPVDG